MADLEPLRYGKVVGRFLANLADGPDIDDLPEFRPMTGTITFAADVPKFLVPTAVPDPATVVQLSQHYVCSLDEFGYLTWRGQRGVRLVAPTGEVNPSGWTWRVTFDLRYDGDRITLPPFSFHVPEYIAGPDPEDPDTGSAGLVDLTLVSPVPSSPGNAVTQGVSVVSVSIDGNALTFGLSNGTFLPAVEVPAIQAALDAADAAEASASAAADSASDAADSVASFDLEVGTVTTGAPGDPAQVTITGGPAFTMDVTLPKGDTGPTGPAAPDATDTVKGIIQLAGDLAGTAAAPTVPGLAGKAPAVHTHPATDISDSTSVGRSVLTAANAGAARTAIGAGTSSLALGTTGGTACEGNDARLSDARPPTSAGQVYDIAFVAQIGQRATGAGNVVPQGIKLRRNIRITEVTYRGATADASGNTSIELRRNGSQISGTEKTIAAADQTAGGANATATGTWDLDAGDVLLPYVTAVGTTPGNNLIADIKAVTR